MAGPVPALDSRAEACARRLLRADRVLLVSHIDADGLTSAAIAAKALERAGLPFESAFEKQLDPTAIEAIAARREDTVLFTDFGSGQLDVIGDYEDSGAFTPIVVDHHQPADRDTEHHLNPLLEGIDGASELSGAGASYVLARALATIQETPNGSQTTAADGGNHTEPDATITIDSTEANPTPDTSTNTDLAGLAVVGAVGDMQASSGALHGANEAIVEEGVEAGVLETGTDLALYGKQTRPLPKLLEYASDVRIPGITNDTNGTLRFLDDLDIELRRDGTWRHWADLTEEERQHVVSALIRRGVTTGVPAERINDLIGTSYVLTAEPVGSELRDASEFSTLLNATARYERADVGLGVCLGNRGDVLERARTLLRDHRRNLSEGIDFVTEAGVTTEGSIQWFHAEDRIRETIVGIVAGMAMGNAGVRADKPIVAFANKSDEDVKVSARGTHRLVRQGLDLSVVIGNAARSVGGDGGGHDVAAGATIPSGCEQTFIERLDDLVTQQLTDE